MKARIEGDTVLLRGEGGYTGDFPISDLARWATFYRKLRDREGGKYAVHYMETVDQLEALQRAAPPPA